jgi:U3 small nucleolar ribonucleoprotein component
MILCNTSKSGDSEKEKFIKDRIVNRNFDDLPQTEKEIIRESRAGLVFDNLSEGNRETPS